MERRTYWASNYDLRHFGSKYPDHKGAESSAQLKTTILEKVHVPREVPGVIQVNRSSAVQQPNGSFAECGVDGHLSQKGSPKVER